MSALAWLGNLARVFHRFYDRSRWVQVGVHVLAAWAVLETVHAVAGAHPGAARGRAAAPHLAAGDTNVGMGSPDLPPPTGPVGAPLPPRPPGALTSGLVAEVLDLRSNTRICSFPVPELPYSWKVRPGPDTCRLAKGARFRVVVAGLARVAVDGPTWVSLGNTAGAARAALGGVPLFDFAEPRPGAGPSLHRRREASLEAGWIRLTLEYDGMEGVPGSVDLDITKAGATGRTLAAAELAHDAG